MTYYWRKSNSEHATAIYSLRALQLRVTRLRLLLNFRDQFLWIVLQLFLNQFCIPWCAHFLHLKLLTIKLINILIRYHIWVGNIRILKWCPNPTTCNRLLGGRIKCISKLLLLSTWSSISSCSFLITTCIYIILNIPGLNSPSLVFGIIILKNIIKLTIQISLINCIFLWA